MLLGEFAFTYLSHAVREVAPDDEGLIQKILFALELVAVVVFSAATYQWGA
jgi:hypothetical protein